MTGWQDKGPRWARLRSEPDKTGTITANSVQLPPGPPCYSNTVLPEYTFVNVRRQSTHKHLAGISFHSLPVLVSKAVRWTQATMKRLIPTAIIQESIFHRKQWRLTWNRKQNRKLIGRAPRHWLSHTPRKIWMIKLLLLFAHYRFTYALELLSP